MLKTTETIDNVPCDKELLQTKIKPFRIYGTTLLNFER